MYTDLREYLRGRQPEDTGTGHLPGAVAATTFGSWVVDGSGRDRRLLALSAPDEGISTLTWNPYDGLDDAEISVLFRMPAVGAGDNALGVLRYDAAGAGYVISYLASNSLSIKRWSGGVSSLVGASFTILFPGSWYWLRARTEGTWVRAVVWGIDDAVPVGWVVEYDDPSPLAAGNFGVAIAAGSSIEIEALGLSEVPGTAPTAGPRTLEEVLLDPTAQIQATFELETRVPGGADETEWFSQFPLVAAHDDFPAGKMFRSVLRPPGSVTEGLSADLLFGGFAPPSPPEVRLNNELNDLWYLGARAIAGRRGVLRLGEIGRSHRAYSVVGAYNARSNPSVGSDVSVPLATSADAFTEKVLQRGRYLGVPVGLHVVSGALANATAKAAYEVTQFTVGGAFRLPIVSSNQNFGFRQASSFNRHWLIAMWGGTSVTDPEAARGRLLGRSSVAGVHAVINIISPTSYDDGLWHTVVYAVGPGEAYLLVDGEVVGWSYFAGTPDLAAGWDIKLGNNSTTDFCNWGFFDFYLRPEEAAARFRTRLDGTSPGLVDAWPMDDNAGAVATSSVAGGTNLVLTGTYSWIPTDLGNDSQAGALMPITEGMVYNVPADVVRTTVPSRIRISDRSYTGEPIVRDRGVELSETTDFTQEGDGVLELAAYGGLVTCDLEGNDPGTANPDNRFAHVLSLAPAVLETRTALEAYRDLATLEWTGLGRHLPWESGLHYPSGAEVPAQVVLDELLGTAGIAYYLDESGRLKPSYLVPPCLPDPWGELDPVLEFQGGGQALWSNMAPLPATHTIALWYKPWRVDPEYAAIGGVWPPGQTLVDCYNRIALDPHFPGRIRAGYGLNLQAQTFQGTARAREWNFVMLVHDPTKVAVTERRRLYAASPGGAIRLVAQGDLSGAYSPDPLVSFKVGNGLAPFWGAVAEVSAWSKALSVPEGQDLVDARTDAAAANLSFLARFDEGRGRPVDLVSGRQAIVDGVRWAPAAVLDATNPGVAMHDTTQQIRPAWQVTPTCRPNYRRMSDADFAGSLALEERPPLRSEHLEGTPFVDRSVLDDHRDAQAYTLLTKLWRRQDAEEAARYVFERSAGQAAVISAVPRQVLVELTDELVVTTQESRDAWRVVERQVDRGNLTAGFGLWRP